MYVISIVAAKSPASTHLSLHFKLTESKRRQKQNSKKYYECVHCLHGFVGVIGYFLKTACC